MSDPSIMQKTAQNAVLQVFARYAMIGVATIGMPLAGLAGKRILDNLDNISAKQDSTRDDINNIRIAIVEIKGANTITNNRIDEISRVSNSRIDALSAWTRTITEEVNKLKDAYYKR